MRLFSVQCLLYPTLAAAFCGPSSSNVGVSTTKLSTMLHLAPAKNVFILPNEDQVTKAVHRIVQAAATQAIAEKGTFTLAIPGGSVLKLFSSLQAGDWVQKTTLAYVNHKCVPNDDLNGAIHAKARSMFLDRWGLETVITLMGTDDAKAEAAEYDKKLRAIPTSVLLRDADGYPVFDLCLIGVGDDGHIGSLYPNRDEILEKDVWAIGVEMKNPPSISLTLPVMMRAKQSVVSAAGQSEKYPKGKSAAMRLAIEDENITPQEFPACALRETATWILDEANASDMPGLKRSTLDEFAVV
jgi:6-phosphogluconolactonase